MSHRPAVAIAAAAGWLLLTAGYGAAATEPAVDLGGAPLPNGTGSTDPVEPTVLDPGLWADTLGAAESARAGHRFTYERRMRFSTVHVGVIGAPVEAGDGLEVQILGPEGLVCDTASASSSYAVPQEVMGARVWAGPAAADDLQHECLHDPALDIVVTRTAGGGDLPVAIKVVEEAPTTGAEALPAPEEAPSFRPGTEPTGGAEIVGATDFGSAPAISISGGGAAFSTSVREGQQRLYRLPLTWGQGLFVEALVPAIDAAVEEDRYGYPDVELSLVDPIRDTVDDAVGGTTPSGITSADEGVRLSTGLPALSYLNRYADGPATVPGDYWLSVAVSVEEGFEPLDVPLHIEVVRTEEEGGEPVYDGSVQAPDSDAGPAAYTPETPFLIGPEEFSAVASGSPVHPDGGDGAWWGPRRYAGIGLALASLVCCGLGVRRLVR